MILEGIWRNFGSFLKEGVSPGDLDLYTEHFTFIVIVEISIEHFVVYTQTYILK